MMAYYNEIDPYAAQWLRNLISEGLIADGFVDERSIVDVQPRDLRGFDQCHFFAGIAGWSYALRLAGWDDDRSVWTGSCPCQPFSAAGSGKAANDERHLWPAWFSLIRECKPAVIFGEQVEAAIGWGWLDLVFSDLETEGYACGAAVLPACSVGAPHRRNRLWFVADAGSGKFWRRQEYGQCSSQAREMQGETRQQRLRNDDSAGCATSDMADSNGRNACAEGLQRGWEHRQQPQDDCVDRLADTGCDGREECGRSGMGGISREEWIASQRSYDSPWSDLEWLECRDGKARPTKPGIQFMADGLPESLGPVCPNQINEIEDEINGKVGKGIRGEAMLYLWQALAEKTVRYPVGGLRSLQEAPVLLSFVCQLTAQGWIVPKGVPQSREEASRSIMRMLRGDEEVACSSYRRGLDEQQSIELTNAVRLLSSILAQYAQTAWSEAFNKNARDAFPLASSVSNRMGKLRAAGNAIVPQVAAEFIGAFLECAP